MEKEKNLKFHTLIKALNNSYESKQESNSYFWGLSNSLYNIKDIFKYNLLSLNYKLYPYNEKSIIHVYNKDFDLPNLEYLNYKLKSLILITYRNNYKPQINNKNNSIYNSDCGWGCTIRSGQMILAKAIYKVFKYENYKKEKKLDKASLIKSVIYYFLDNNLVLDNKNNEKYYGMQPYISKLKEYVDKTYLPGKKDIYSIEPPFSIQKICIMSEIIGKTCGEWYSDFDLPKIFNYINNGFNVFPNIKIEHYNTNVNITKIIESCFEEISKEKSCDKYILFKDKKYIFEKMGIIFISIRLGLNTISNEYFPNIKKIFNCKEILGFIGGKPRAASYFFGYVDDNFLFLDPHYNQTSVKDLEKEGIYSYIDKTIYKLPMTSLQTALTLGFLFRNIDEFIDFMEFCIALSKDSNPIFFISNLQDLDLNRKE